MYVFSEAGDRELPPSASLRDIRASTEAARLFARRVIALPSSFERCGDAEGALWMAPRLDSEAPAFWIGFIPQPERYRAVYEAAARRGLRLPNGPEENRRAMEMDRAGPLLGDLTPASIVMTGLDDLGRAAEIGFPVFVKGAVQSLKSLGWKACVAEDAAELRRLAKGLFARESRSRGRVMVRRLLRLRHSRCSAEGFPLGREYRVFVYRGRVAARGYYWEGADPLAALEPEEARAVDELALEAARRLQVPYLAVDIGQSEDGAWWVIEVGDGQFAGLSQASALGLWSALNELSGSY